MTCWRVTSETAMIAAAREAYRGTRNRWLIRSTKREAQGMTYQSRPWQTQTAGHFGAERNGVFRVEQDVDAVPIHGGGDRELVPAQDRAPGQGHFLDRTARCRRCRRARGSGT